MKEHENKFIQTTFFIFQPNKRFFHSPNQTQMSEKLNILYSLSYLILPLFYHLNQTNSLYLGFHPNQIHLNDFLCFLQRPWLGKRDMVIIIIYELLFFKHHFRELANGLMTWQNLDFYYKGNANALVNNPFKEKFYGKWKKKVINILTAFFIPHKSGIKNFLK